jgi:hypothetical protein
VNWFEIVVLSVLFELTNWLKDRKVISLFKRFYYCIYNLCFLKVCLSLYKIAKYIGTVSADPFCCPDYTNGFYFVG